MFQDKVFDKISTFQNETRIFAADLYYHSNCMRRYTKRYEKHVEVVLSNLELEDGIATDDDVTSAFNMIR